MKNRLKVFSIIFLALVGCHSKNVQHVLPIATIDTFSKFIIYDTANKMLGSYLNSINYTKNDSDVQSFSIDVKQLRRYIDSMPTSSNITNIKVMFAHTLPYANSSHGNHYSGYKSNALTLIIAAYDSNGNYIYYQNNKVLDYSSPCPPSCPPGNAGGSFLTQ